MRALRLLVHILSDPVMFSKFREGDLAGKWLEGTEQFLLEAGSELTLVGLQRMLTLGVGNAESMERSLCFCTCTSNDVSRKRLRCLQFSQLLAVVDELRVDC